MTLPKLFALSFFIIFPVMGFLFGMQYQKSQAVKPITPVYPIPAKPTVTNKADYFYNCIEDAAP